MIQFTIFSVPVTICYSFFLAVSLFLLSDTVGVGLILFSVVFLHEAGHGIAMIWDGIPIRAVQLTAFGVSMERDDETILSLSRELAVYAMGPAANFVTALLLTPWRETGWGRAALGFSLVLGLVNLLPVEPLDGGTVVRLLTDRLPGKAGRRLCNFLSWAALAGLWLGGFYGIRRLGTPYILLFAVLLTLDGKN